MIGKQRRGRGERGQVIALFALMLPVFMGLGAIVIGVGNWYTHAKHLQTKADASALAGGGVWGFPCGETSDAIIEAQARRYVGPHTQADGTVFNSTSLNPQLGGVDETKIHAVLNGSAWYDDDSNPSPAEKDSPAGSICEAMVLDVKVTEDNSFPLFSLLPLFPDIKRKARVQIEEIESLSGVLPVSVRVPRPTSAAAIFYDEASGNILPGGVKYFCDNAVIPGMPAGLQGWTTLAPTHPSGLCPDWANINVAPTTGVAIATSFRPACDATVTTNCFEDSGFATVDQLCRQGSGRIVKCFFATGAGSSQTTQAGLQFIRGYEAPPAQVGNGPPVLGSAWLEPGGCSGGYGSGYFAAVTGNCSSLLKAEFELGTCLRGPGQCFDDPSQTPPEETRTADNTEVKYTLVYGPGNADHICDFGATCDLSPSWSTTVTYGPQNSRYAIALRVRLKNTFVPDRPGCSDNKFNGQCEWYFTSSGRQPTQPPNAEIFRKAVQRPFMGDDDRSGPIKFLRLSADPGCNNPNGLADYQDYQAGSVQIGDSHCFFLEMGLRGGLAQDQDQTPIAFNITGGSQNGLVDCDPVLDNVRQEIAEGCTQPSYAPNRFDTDPVCPGASQFFVTPKPAPFDDWAPFRCVMTQTGASSIPGQVIQGLNLRFFNVQTNPQCPAEDTSPWVPPQDPPWTKGRNYWHDANNQIDEYTFAQDSPPPARSNRLREDDPRKVNLFMSGYDTFTGSGQATFPVVTIGTFYITGYGQRSGGTLTIHDPCSDGSSDPSPGAGNKPPPDLPTGNGIYIWGHFINDVKATPGSTPSGKVCAPTVSFLPCMPVLVE